jgi:hypothetical protein
MEQLEGQHSPQDRRTKPRINCDYQAIVRGSDPLGKSFEETTRLVNLSLTGLFIQLNRSVPKGDELAVTILLPFKFPETNDFTLATNGVVVRSEHHNEASYGVAVKILGYRFL